MKTLPLFPWPSVGPSRTLGPDRPGDNDRRGWSLAPPRLRPAVFAPALIILLLAMGAAAFQQPARAPLPNFDRREKAGAKLRASEQTKAVEELQKRVPKATVDFNPITGSPQFIAATDGFLTGSGGAGRAVSRATAAAIPRSDPHRAVKAFLSEHHNLFGHGPEALDRARIQRDFTTAHNGLQTFVWEQQVDGIPVFEALLVAHTTRQGELVNLSSHFLPDSDAAANLGMPDRAAAVAAPSISPARALTLAARDLGANAEPGDVMPSGAAEGAARQQKFTSAFARGEATAKLAWLPMNRQTLRLCWDVLLEVHQHGELYRVLLDAQTGEVIIRRCLTAYISPAAYRVFTGDSPTPLSPGYASPRTNQPPLAARTVVTLAALDTNASPNGWIDDGVNETRGNNVDAHTDRNGNNFVDEPRPTGSPFRVFNPPLDLTTQDPLAYSNAAVVQLFYWCNWMHDTLYQLGFTEAAGNFQGTNFGRGGLGNDALQADAQDGSGFNYSSMSTPADGFEPRLQMYLFTGPSPRRDGALDAEIVLHEYTHGLSARLVGGGVGLYAPQSLGLSEGWSDFYALALLSEAGDDPNGNYAALAYTAFNQPPGFVQNYYYGARRFPYTTDRNKNPLTFKDIDPNLASAPTDIPRNPAVSHDASEYHNQGEVWCVTLWEARANLIARHGFSAGNQLILQLVTDGMKLSPVNPNFLQARDAIIQADLVNNGGANRKELWAAFGKRGLGAHAICPDAFTTYGVEENFDLPDPLFILPSAGFATFGPVGGPFSPNNLKFTLTNDGTAPLMWTLVNTSAWLNVSATSGTLDPGGPVAGVTVSLNTAADMLPRGLYSASILFSNLTSGATMSRLFSIWAGGSRVAVFDNPTYVDTGGNIYSESDTLQASLRSLGIPVITFTSIVATLDTYQTIIIPEQENRPLALDLTMAERAGLSNFVFHGGKLIVHGNYPSYSAGSLLNNVFGFSIVEGYNGYYFNARTPDATGTEFADDSPEVPSNNDYTTVLLPHTLPAGAVSLYTNYSGSAVVLIEEGNGLIVFLGWDWQEAAPMGTLDGGWLGILESAVLQGPLPPRPPAITSQPEGSLIARGGSASFNVAAVGSIPLSYQWRHDGLDVLHATNSTLLLTNAGDSDAGHYTAVVTNRFGSTTSAVATLTVLNLRGVAAYFTDNDPFSYGPAAPVYQALSPLGIPPFQVTDITTYDLSDAALLFLDEADNFGPSPLLASRLPALENWVRGGGKLFVHDRSAGNLTPNPFLFGATGVVTVRFATTNLDVVPPGDTLVTAGPFGVISNATLDGGLSSAHGYVPQSQLPAGAVALLSVGQAPSNVVAFAYSVGQGFVYYSSIPLDCYLVGGECNANPIAVALQQTYTPNALLYLSQLNCADCPPTIVTQPSSHSALIGSPTMLSVEANGTKPLAYQWLKEGTNLPNVTNASYVIANFQHSDAGHYSVVVTNLFGATTSVVATLNAVSISGTVAYLSDFNEFTTGPEGPILRAGLFPLRVTDISSYNLNSASVLFIDEISNGGPSSALQGRLPAIQSWVNSGGILVVHDRSAGNLSSNPFLLGTTGIVPVRFETSDVDVVPPGVTLVTAGPFGFINNATLDGGSSSAHGYVPRNQLPATATPILSTAGNPNNVISFSYPLGLGLIYYSSIPLDCYLENGGCGSSPISLALQNIYTPNVLAYAIVLGVCTNCPPRFTLQPTNQYVLPGTNVSLTAAAVGTGPVRYQWRLEGTNIPNATNATYTFTNASLANHGKHSVVATDDVGSATSSNALIYVLVRPGFAVQPIAQSVLQGGTATFTAVATGAPPIWYRWVRNGVPVTTNQAGVFVVTNVQTNAFLRVSATNLVSGVAGVNSLTVQLTMIPDFDGDGMADAWEVQYGFNTNNAADALLDFDGDGVSNRDEYRAGTDPANPLSVLKLALTTTNAGVLQFVAQSNVAYTVQYRTDLRGASWTKLSNIAAQSLVRTAQVSVPNPPPEVERYYRIVTPPVP